MSKARHSWYSSNFSKTSNKLVEKIQSSSSTEEDADEDLRYAQEESKDCWKKQKRIRFDDDDDVVEIAQLKAKREENRRVYKVSKHRRLLKKKLLAQLDKLDKWEASGFYAQIVREKK